MKLHLQLVTPLVLLGTVLAVSAPAQAAPVTIVGYDVNDTPGAGFGGWTHDYFGTIANLGRVIPGPTEPGGSGGCPCVLFDYSQGIGTLNDGVVTATTAGAHAFTNRTLADGPILPAITIYLDGFYKVEEIRLFGGDFPNNALPGAIEALTVEIGGVDVFVTTTALGTLDTVDLRSTPLSTIATDRILLRDFQASFRGFPTDGFVLGEIEVDGQPNVIPVSIDIAPGDPYNRIQGKKVVVAILSTPAFNAVAEVSTPSLTFGVTGNEPTVRSCLAKGFDVNRDGRRDVVCEFTRVGTGFNRTTKTGVLKGLTFGGTPILGQDFVRVQ